VPQNPMLGLTMGWRARTMRILSVPNQTHRQVPSIWRAGLLRALEDRYGAVERRHRIDRIAVLVHGQAERN